MGRPRAGVAPRCWGVAPARGRRLSAEVPAGLMVSEAARIQVTAVRITGAHGLAVLSFGTPLERQMPVQRGHGTWKIAELLDRELP